MNAQTKNKTLTTEQADRVFELLKNATEGFKARFFDKNTRLATQEDIAEFVEKITPRIKESILKGDHSEETSKRADRLKTVNALAASHGIKFTHRREQEIHEAVIDYEVVDKRHDIETVEITAINTTRGGETIAFKYTLNEKNELGIEYSVAFCRPDENFDPLIGKEIALQKFLASKRCTTQITHEPFGQVKLTQLCKKFRTAENSATRLVSLHP